MATDWVNGYLERDEYRRAVARGQVNGAQLFGAYGKRTTSGAASGVVWPNGAYAFPAAAGVQMSVVSTSANDAAAGTGIRTMDIHYLDANLDSQFERVTLNGLTPVLTVATNIRFIQCMHVVTAGSGKAAAGTITASNAGQDYSQIDPGAVRCSSSVRMVPRGKRLIIYAMAAGAVSGTAAAQVVVEPASPTFEEHNFTADGIFVPVAAGAFQDNSLAISAAALGAYTEGQAFGMIFSADKACTVVASWFGILENAA